MRPLFGRGGWRGAASVRGRCRRCVVVVVSFVCVCLAGTGVGETLRVGEEDYADYVEQVGLESHFCGACGGEWHRGFLCVFEWLLTCCTMVDDAGGRREA